MLSSSAALPFVYDLRESVHYIKADNVQDLKRILDNVRLLGIDTETRPSFLFNSRRNSTSIIQLAIRNDHHNEQVAIVDLLDIATVVDSLSQLNEILSPVLTSKSIIKIGQGLVHDFQELCKTYPSLSSCRTVQSIVDTNTLYRFLKPEIVQEVSLKNLVLAFLHCDLLKTYQCSDWGRRPLSASQLHYAACDALVLLRLYDVMSCEAEEKGNFDLEVISRNYVFGVDGARKRKLTTAFDASISGCDNGVPPESEMLPLSRYFPPVQADVRQGMHTRFNNVVEEGEEDTMTGIAHTAAGWVVGSSGSSSSGRQTTTFSSSTATVVTSSSSSSLSSSSSSSSIAASLLVTNAVTSIPTSTTAPHNPHYHQHNLPGKKKKRNKRGRWQPYSIGRFWRPIRVLALVGMMLGKTASLLMFSIPSSTVTTTTIKTISTLSTSALSTSALSASATSPPFLSPTRTVGVPRTYTTTTAAAQLQLWSQGSRRTTTDTFHTVITVLHDGCKAGSFVTTNVFNATSNTRAYLACKSGHVTVNGRKVFATRVLRQGDQLEVLLPAEQPADTTKSTMSEPSLLALLNFRDYLCATDRNPPCRVLYEDDSVAVVYKPAGVHTMQWVGTMQRQQLTLMDVLPLLLTHPHSTSATTTEGLRLEPTPAPADENNKEVYEAAEEGVSSSCKAVSPLPRPLPCHRLDARVAGCVVVAKTFQAIKDVTAQFAQRTVHKEYTAVLVGNVSAAIVAHSINTPYHNLSIHTQTKLSMVDNLSVAMSGKHDEMSYQDRGQQLEQELEQEHKQEQDKGQEQVADTRTVSPTTVSPTRVSPTTVSPTSIAPIPSTASPHRYLHINSLVDGLHARTDLRILSTTPCAVYGAVTQVLLYPSTGRRHQLRRHCASLGTPIVGDSLYHAAAFHDTIEARMEAIQSMSVGKIKKAKVTNEEVEVANEVIEVAEEGDDGEADGMDEEDDGEEYVDMIDARDRARVGAKESGSDFSRDVSDVPVSQVPIPRVRKGIGLFLACTSVAFDHPLHANQVPVSSNDGDDDGGDRRTVRCMNRNDDGPTMKPSMTRRRVIHVKADAPPRFASFLEKAKKGFEWEEKARRATS